MYLDRFRFWEEDPRPNRWFQILEKKNLLSIAIVVGSIGGQPGSDRIYRVDRATSWIGQT